MNILKPNYIIFFVLSFIIILVSTSLFAPKDSKKPAQSPLPTTENALPLSASESLPSDSLPSDSLPTFEIEQGKLITIKSPLYVGTVDTLGGRITKWELLKYNSSTQNGATPVDVLLKTIEFNNTKLIVDKVNVPSPIPFSYSGPAVVEFEYEKKEVVLVWKSGGLEIKKTYVFDPKSYFVEQTVEVTNQTGGPINELLLTESAATLKQKKEDEYSTKFVALENGSFEKEEETPEEAKEFDGIINWFGFAEKYFMAVVLPEVGGNTKIRLSPTQEPDVAKSLFGYGQTKTPNGVTSKKLSKLYLGPIDFEDLKETGQDLEKVVDFGWIGFIARPTLAALNIVNEWFHNYGIAIIVITVFIRLIFLPLTLKSMESMKAMQNKMQTLKPKIEALKEKFKDDKVKQNKELMQLYSSHGVNPLSSLGGCLPMLIQIPVFIALYEVLLYSIELRHSAFLWIDNLAEPENLFMLPLIDVPFRALPLIMGVSWFMSQKLTPTTAPGTDNNIQMKMMQYMPIIFTVMFWGLPSGLILYWTISNLLSIVQQLYVNHSMAKKRRA